MSRAVLPLALAATLSASPAAQACGGFFCSQAQPVIQNSERIVFSVDGDQIETHVQIFYEGPSEQFSWIVPVPSEPDTFLSTDSLFDTLAFQTGPTFQINRIDEGNCRDGGGIFRGGDASLAAPESADTVGGVEVISLKQVGPYDTAVLLANNSGELMSWLEENGYDLADDMEALLDPYISENAHFLALKLSKNKDTGDIAPIGFRYTADKAQIPIQLTAVAAAPDMRLETYVFADHRAVPESYLHVQINEAAVNWWNGGQNYANVITKAANEAGGHAFATDFAGDPEFLVGQLWTEGRISMTSLRQAPNAEAWLDEIRFQIPANNTLMQVVEAYIDVPNGADVTDFYNCPSCFNGWDRNDFDAAAATDDLEALVIEPLRTAEALFEHKFVSRMTSSLDAVEMTVDPVFVQNPDMGAVTQTHQADLIYECNGRKRERAGRRLELADGRAIDLPSEDWFDKNDTTEFQFIRELGLINAQIIEKTGASGQPEILNDYTGQLARQTNDFNDQLKSMMGCGCSSSGGPTGGFLALALAGILARRRR